MIWQRYGKAVIGTIALAATILAGDVPGTIQEKPENGVRFLVWNIQRGSNNFEDGPEKALKTIKAVDPDVALLQESYDVDGDRPQLGIWMAGELGWNAYQSTSPHLCILSKQKPVETFFHHDWHGLGARFQIDKNRRFTAYSIWIDWRSYVGSYLRDNPDATDEEVLEGETKRSSRFDQATALLEHLKEENRLNKNEQLFVGGDWNCPSHLDWTEETEKAFHWRRNLPLPVSTMMQENGFLDTFRAVHPNPVSDPANTWSPLYRSDVMNRIDRLYSLAPNDGPKLVPVKAFTLPYPYEDERIPQAKREFPSDHAAVVIDFVWS